MNEHTCIKLVGETFYTIGRNLCFVVETTGAIGISSQEGQHKSNILGTLIEGRLIRKGRGKSGHKEVHGLRHGVDRMLGKWLK